MTLQCSSGCRRRWRRALVVRAQLIGARWRRRAGRLVHLSVRLERGDARFDVAGRERAQVLADDVGLAHVGVGLEQRRAARVAAGQRPAAEVQPQLDDPLVLLVVGDDRKGKPDASAVAVEVHDDLFDPARIRDEEVTCSTVPVAFRQPGRRVGDEAPERGLALDPPAHRVMYLGHARNESSSASISPVSSPSKKGTTRGARAGTCPVRAAARGRRRSRAPRARGKHPTAAQGGRPVS